MNNINDIKKSRGSHYTQSNVVEEVIKNSDKRLAVVTVGCQSEAIDLLVKRGIIPRPKYVIGLICERQYSINIIDEFSKGKKIKYYRARDKIVGGWPGNVRIVTTDDKDYSYDRNERYLINDYYQHYRCMQCADMNNVNADIICGDPWCYLERDGLEKLKRGYTVVYPRSEKANQLVLSASNDGYIQIKKDNARPFLNENLVGYNFAGRAFLAHQIAKREGLPCLYDDEMTPSAELTDSEVISKYNRWCLYSFRSNLANNKFEFNKIVNEEKKKDRIKVIKYRVKKCY